MARDIERIVANHQVARELRQQGTPIWRRTVDVKAVLQQLPADPSDEDYAELCRQVAQRLRAAIPESVFDPRHELHDPDFTDLVEKFADATAASLKVDEEVTGLPVADVIDDWLSELYDWADRERVWLGW